MYSSKKIPYSSKANLKEAKDGIKIMIALFIILPISSYFILPSFRLWYLSTSIWMTAATIGVFLGFYSRKRRHLVEMKFDESKNKFIAKSNSGKVLNIPPHWIGRVEKNEDIGMWRYAYIEDKSGDRLIPLYFSPGKKFDDNKGRHKLRATLVPYEVDEWIQRIKANHQTEENHDLIVRR